MWSRFYKTTAWYKKGMYIRLGKQHKG
jgi:hypothetical protein